MPRLCLPFALPSAGYLPMGDCLQPTPRGVECLEGHELRCTRRLSSSPPIPIDTYALCLTFAYRLALPSAEYLRQRACLQPTPRGVECLEGHKLRCTRRLSSSLHPSPLTRTRCASLLLTISLCRVQYTFQNAYAFNQPLEAWDVSRVTALQVRAASRPLSRITATASHHLCLLYTSPSPRD